MIKIAKNSTMNSDIKVLSFVYTLSSWNILNQINSWTKLATAFFPNDDETKIEDTIYAF